MAGISTPCRYLNPQLPTATQGQGSGPQSPGPRTVRYRQGSEPWAKLTTEARIMEGRLILQRSIWICPSFKAEDLLQQKASDRKKILQRNVKMAGYIRNCFSLGTCCAHTRWPRSYYFEYRRFSGSACLLTHLLLCCSRPRNQRLLH